ncbi:Uncharacterised protein [Salmonella enterica subsp. enterica serovar Madelia]|nr:Uncharacterised protein [Salmonella enterica subsp. enterica serovar Madelia]
MKNELKLLFCCMVVTVNDENLFGWLLNQGWLNSLSWRVTQVFINNGFNFWFCRL